MASVTKTVSGSTITFTVTDSTGAAATLIATNNPVTGLVVAFGGAAVHGDAMAIISSLTLQLQTGLVPGAGAYGLQP